MAFTMRVSESEKIVNRWIDQAADVIETVTGVRQDNDSLLYQLSDCEWIFTAGEIDGEDCIEMVQALKQLSFIVERMIDQIREEQNDD